MKDRQTIIDKLNEYVYPFLEIVYNPNLQEEAEARMKNKRDSRFVHNGSGNMSDPVMTEYSDHMIFGVFTRPDCRTIEYDDDSRILFIIHEICHLLCLRSAYKPEFHSPDFYGWAVGMDERINYWCIQEEMTAGFLGFIIQGKLGIVWDCLYHDMATQELSDTLNFPNKCINLSGYDVPDGILMDNEQRVWLACDADLSPLYRIKSSDDINADAQSHGAFERFGSLHHRLLGILDNDNNIIGRINPSVVKANKNQLQELWKVHPNELDDFVEFWCL